MNYATAVPNYTLGTAPLDLLGSLPNRAEGEERGAIYTRAEVVNFILDLVGYRSEKPLWQYRILEPSFGGGDFLLPTIDRLLSSIEIGAKRPHRSEIRSAIRAVELHGETYSATHQAVYRRLCSAGFNDIEASEITNEWLSQGDFLLTHFNQRFTHIVGNPPYVRQENVPDALMALYRERYETIYDRADIYVPFIERSLELLSDDGKLSFICADRWMKNRYGSKLRELISRNYSLTAYVDMVGSNAFLSEVSAYPAITLMERGVGKQTRVSGCPELSATVLGKLANDLTAPAIHANSLVTQTGAIAVGNDPWVFNSLAELTLVRHLEAKYPLLEEAGCKVGIGVATGADKAFIGNMDDLDVETSRKLPLVMSKDIVTGDVQWRGMGVINPFGLDGKLVDLERFPKLKAYLNARKSVIAKRHVAEKSPKNWYRTIDRIYPDLVQTPKLLIPDIKGDAHIVYDPGLYYPHHNLYFIVSNDWDLRALKLVLSSGIARLFVALYSTKMRGGYFRFQAQYLRRIRVPRWSDVPIRLQDRILQAVNSASTAEINNLVAELYQLSAAERSLIE